MASEPTSLMLESGQRVDRGEVFVRLMASLDDALEKLEGGTLLGVYREHLEGVGSTVVLQDGREGIMQDVDASGGLVIRTSTATIVVHSGDVSLRSPDKA
jgi:biotin-(acetyl-CoA carboxylase) ligase